MTLDHDACYRIFLARDRRFDGRVFVGVRTTGIYCRPICPAPPPRQCNVSFYASAALAQEAGFRPCLRCRPEVSPDFAAWRGSSSTVVRALRLIQGGALDQMTAEDFASRLGVGARQLRRLFVEHVGAPPRAFAQLRRVHLAKQLIQETDLPMIEVAYASGYGSVRRFNEAFQLMFGRPPAALRRRPIGAAAPAGVLSLQLSFAPPYDWMAMMDRLARRAIAGVECVEPNAYRRTIDVDGAKGAIHVARVDDGRLRVDLRVSKLDALPQIITRIRELFDLAADPLVLAEQLAGDPALSSLVTAKPGLRIPGCWDTFELIVRTIFGERLTRPPSSAMMREFVRAFGEPAPNSGDGLTHFFPSLGRIRGADLSSVAMTARQSDAIASYVEAALAQATPVTAFAPIEETIDWLLALAGFDREMAVTIATRLGEPTDDVSGLAASHIARIDKCRPWRAYAALHLLEAGKLAVGEGLLDAA
jgi:AraC family transcriptional regulator of adaptative response / DNA-3-methyladenine glycosylase II